MCMWPMCVCRTMTGVITVRRCLHFSDIAAAPTPRTRSSCTRRLPLIRAGHGCACLGA